MPLGNRPSRIENVMPCHALLRCLLFVSLAAACVGGASRADHPPAGRVLNLDFAKDNAGTRLMNGAKYSPATVGGRLEFAHHLQYAEAACAGKLDNVEAVTVGGWFFPRRSGEQYFLFRGLPEVA